MFKNMFPYLPAYISNKGDQKMYADLHLHTTASDGSNAPAEVVALAREKGFAAIAITDHDTVEGLAEALEAGTKLGVEVIPGIELSTLEHDREIHILGYYLDWENELLQAKLKRFIEARRERAVKMVEKLNTLGCHISLKRVKEISGGPFIGRPHIARALLEKGYINELSDAFTADFIGRGGRAYAERFKLTPPDGIQLVLQFGGIPVLAHPGFLSKGEPLQATELTHLVDAGLLGMEIIYSKHTPEQQHYYGKIARDLGLIITGGSDCHGDHGGNPLLGSIRLPYQHVETLKAYLQSKK